MGAVIEGDNFHIVFFTCFIFSDVNVEYPFKSLDPIHAPRVIRLVRLVAFFFIDKFRAVLFALRCGDLGYW